MGKFALKYILVLTGTLFAFINFVACGAQMYQVSLDDDHDRARVAKNSPEALDPTSEQFGIHAPAGWVELPIKYKLSKELTADQRAGLKQAMSIWEKAVGRKLFEFVGEDEKTGESFKDLYSSLSDSINSHYMERNWEKTGKSPMVLATTIWDNSKSDLKAISTADIHFNAAYYLIGDSLSLTRAPDEKREVVDMVTLGLHEVGHQLGLTHKDPKVDPYSIMNPSIFIGEGMVNRRLSEGDIRSVQQIYGCEGDACDVEALVIAMESSPNGGVVAGGSDPAANAGAGAPAPSTTPASGTTASNTAPSSSTTASSSTAPSATTPSTSAPSKSTAPVQR